MAKRKSIRQKVSGLTIAVAIVSVLVVGGVTAGGLLYIRGNVSHGYEQFGETTSIKSAEAVIKMGHAEALRMIRKKADIIDSRFEALQNLAVLLSQNAGDILNNSEYYNSRPISADAVSADGSLSTDILWTAGIDTPENSVEAALMGNLQGTMESIVGSNRNVSAAYIGSELGYFIGTDYGLGETPKNYDPRERPWYKDAKEAGAPVWTDIYEDAYDRGLIITCAVPYYDHAGNIAGVAAIDALLTDVTEIINSDPSWSSESTFVIHKRGEIVIDGKVPRDAPFDDLWIYLSENEISEFVRISEDIAAGGTDLAGIFYMPVGKDDLKAVQVYLMPYTPLKTLPWRLVTLINSDDINAPVVEMQAALQELSDNSLSEINSMAVTVMLAFALLLAMTILFILYASRRFAHSLTKPIMVLQEDVGQIAGGKLDHKVDIHTGDEIEELGISVAKMAVELKDYIRNLQNITAEKERIGAELSVATQIQASMLPRIFPPFPDRPEFDIYGSMLPAREVGGDFYDFFLVDEDHLGVVIADVSDKGVPAALFMVIAKTLIKNSAQEGKSPADIFETVNNQLCENNGVDMFVTAFMGILEISSCKFTYVNAGHNPPLICHTGGVFDLLPLKRGFVLAGKSNTCYRQSEIMLSEGDVLFMYTDGVTEAMNRQRKLFTEQKLLEDINKYKDLELLGLLSGVKREIDMFADGAEQADDITMLAIKILKVSGALIKELTLDALTQNLPDVLAFVKEKLDEGNCTSKVQNQVRLAVEEVFVNIAKYAYAPESGSVTVRVRTGNEIVIEFEDTGVPYNPLDRDDPDLPKTAGERNIGGLGVFMVKQIMDIVEYRRENGKNILTIKKRIAS